MENLTNPNPTFELFPNFEQGNGILNEQILEALSEIEKKCKNEWSYSFCTRKN